MTQTRNKIIPHCQSNNYPRWLLDSMARLRNRCEYICIMFPRQQDMFPYQKTIARHWWGSNASEHDFVRRGRQGGIDYFWQIKPIYDAAPYVHAWRGPNEPAVITPEQIHLLVEFYKGLIPLAHQHGIRIAGPELSVGHPGGSAGDDNPDWVDVLNADVGELAWIYENVDICTGHYYGRRVGNQWTGWEDWTLRFQYIIEELHRLGVTPHPWVATEGGLDQHGVPDASGWRGSGHGDYRLYAQQLWECNARLQRFPRMKGYAVFGFTETGWPSFRVDERVWVDQIEQLIMALDHEGEVTTRLTDALLIKLAKTEIPVNESYALYREALIQWPDCWPKSDEAEVVVDGLAWTGRMFYDPSTGKKHALYTIKGDWDPAHFGSFSVDN